MAVSRKSSMAHVTCIIGSLYGSSADHYLRGFAGSPYKYYRIAVIGRLREGDSLYGSTIQFTPRLTDQPR